MAKSRHNTRVRAQSTNPIIAEISEANRLHMSNIDVAAKWIAALMETLHGEKYRIHIDHDCGFVMVRGIIEGPIARAALREAI